MNELKPVFIPLQNEYYQQFRDFRKPYEIRQYGKRWNEEVCKVDRMATLSNGYQKKGRLIRRITEFKRVSGVDLREEDKAAVTAIWGARAIKHEFALIYCQ